MFLYIYHILNIYYLCVSYTNLNSGMSQEVSPRPETCRQYKYVFSLTLEEIYRP